MYRAKQIPVLLFVLILTMLACKKDKQEKPEELQKKQITEVISQAHLGILKGLGMVVYEGVNPPDLAGFYECNSLKLLNSNITTDIIGASLNREKIGFSEFKGNDFSVLLRIRSQFSNFITLGKAVVSGSGNHFTVYLSTGAEHDKYSVKLALLISATKEGQTLKNLKYAYINVGDINNADGVLIGEGKGRVMYESDLESERVASLEF